jgi:hypothetical protein
MTGENLEYINSGNKELSLVYTGLCLQIKGHSLAITGEEDFTK